MPNRKQPPRPAGDTNIRPRWSARLGQWVYDVTYPRWSRGHRTLPEARIARNAMRADNDRGMLTRAPGRLTVGDLVNRHWLPTKENDLSNASSIYGCRWTARHIDAGLGKIALRNLTPSDIETWKRTLPQRFNTKSAALLFARLREVLKWAVDHDLLSRNPASKVKAPKVLQRKTAALEVEDIRNLVAAADVTRHGTLVWLALMTGLRKGELLDLTWKRIDMAVATLRLDDAKSPSGVRSVALAPATVARLQEHRLMQLATFTDAGLPPPQHVFLNDKGLPLKAAFWWWRWNGIRSAAGLPELRFHDLRHAHSSLMGRAGVHPSVMQERMGHARPEMTLGVYTHGSASQQVAAAKAVESLVLAQHIADEA